MPCALCWCTYAVLMYLLFIRGIVGFWCELTVIQRLSMITLDALITFDALITRDASIMFDTLITLDASIIIFCAMARRDYSSLRVNSRETVRQEHHLWRSFYPMRLR